MTTIEKLISEFPYQLNEAIEIAKNAELKKNIKHINNVVILGIGGSGFGGSLANAILYNELPVPLLVEKGYHISNYINNQSLVIACSFSGNTEETLYQVDQAIQKNANIVGITSGGKLAELAEYQGFDYITIPGESKCPRASFGYTLLQIFSILHHYALISASYLEEFENAGKLLSKNQEFIKEKAYSLAGKFYSYLPVLYADSIIEPVLLRGQQQINENAKQLAHINSIPEMNHNELVGWDNPQKIVLDNCVVLILRTSFEFERISRRIEICKTIFEKSAVDLLEIYPEGNTLKEQMLYYIHLLDWVSYYLSVFNNVDSFQIDVINHLKNELAKL